MTSARDSNLCGLTQAVFESAADSTEDSMTIHVRRVLAALTALRDPVRRGLAMDVLADPVVTTFSLSLNESERKMRHRTGLLVPKGEEQWREPMLTALMVATEQIGEAIIAGNIAERIEWDTPVLDGEVSI